MNDKKQSYNALHNEQIFEDTSLWKSVIITEIRLDTDQNVTD